MSIVTLTSDNFKEEVFKCNKPVLVDFYADWCGPCNMMTPLLEELAEELGENLKIGKLNVDDNSEFAMEYEVMSIPTLMIFKEGKLTKTLVGLRSKEELLLELK